MPRLCRKRLLHGSYLSGRGAMGVPALVKRKNGSSELFVHRVVEPQRPQKRALPALYRSGPILVPKRVEMGLARAARNSQVLIKLPNLVDVPAVCRHAMNSRPHARAPQLRVHFPMRACLFIRHGIPKFLNELKLLLNAKRSKRLLSPHSGKGLWILVPGDRNIGLLELRLHDRGHVGSYL